MNGKGKQAIKFLQKIPSFLFLEGKNGRNGGRWQPWTKAIYKQQQLGIIFRMHYFLLEQLPLASASTVVYRYLVNKLMH